MPNGSKPFISTQYTKLNDYSSVIQVNAKAFYGQKDIKFN